MKLKKFLKPEKLDYYVIKQLNGKNIIHRCRDLKNREPHLATTNNKEIIKDIYIAFANEHLKIKVKGERYIYDFSNYKNFLKGLWCKNTYQEESYYTHDYCLEKPYENLNKVIKEVKTQLFIQNKLLPKFIKAKSCFNNIIKPCFIFLFKCIVFALTLKLILK